MFGVSTIANGGLRGRSNAVAFSSAATTAIVPNVLLGQTGNTDSTRTTYSYVSYVNCNSDASLVVVVIYGTLNGKSGIHVSTNGGANFANTYSTPDNFSSVVMSTSGQYMYVNCQNTGRIYRSTNYGQTFTSVTAGASTNISNIDCSDSGQYVYATDFGGSALYQSSDYGQTYTALHSVGASLSIANVWFNQNTNTVFFTSTANGRVYRYNVGTSSATTITVNSNNSNCSGIAVSRDESYYFAIFYGVSSSQLYYSTNQGANWTATSITTASGNASALVSVSCSPSGQYVYCYNYGSHIYCSSNYGASFTAINYSTMFPGSLRAHLNSRHYNVLMLFSQQQGFVKSRYPTTTIPQVWSLQLWHKMDATDVTSTTKVRNYGRLGSACDLTMATATMLTNTSASFKFSGANISKTNFQQSGSEYVSIPAFVTESNGMTFSIWYWLTTTSGMNTDRLFEVNQNITTNDNTGAIALYFNSGKLVAGIGSDTGAYDVIGGTTLITPGTCNNTGVWYHAALTVTAGGSYKLLVNGVLQATVTATYPAGLTRSGFVGYSNMPVSWPASSFKTGQIDDFRYWSVALTDAEIATVYNQGRA